MTIEIKQGRYFLGMWFLRGDGLDFLASVFRDSGQAFRCIYRFRYYKDDKVFDSKDKKSWYEFRFRRDVEETEAESIIDGMVKTLVDDADFSEGVTGPPVEKIMLHTEDCEEIMKRLKQIPHFAMKET